jgi:hypothetical protein
MPVLYYSYIGIFLPRTEMEKIPCCFEESHQTVKKRKQNPYSEDIFYTEILVTLWCTKLIEIMNIYIRFPRGAAKSGYGPRWNNFFSPLPSPPPPARADPLKFKTHATYSGPRVSGAPFRIEGPGIFTDFTLLTSALVPTSHKTNVRRRVR